MQQIGQITKDCQIMVNGVMQLLHKGDIVIIDAVVKEALSPEDLSNVEVTADTPEAEEALKVLDYIKKRKKEPRLRKKRTGEYLPGLNVPHAFGDIPSYKMNPKTGQYEAEFNPEAFVAAYNSVDDKRWRVENLRKTLIDIRKEWKPPRKKKVMSRQPWGDEVEPEDNEIANAIKAEENKTGVNVEQWSQDKVLQFARQHDVESHYVTKDDIYGALVDRSAEEIDGDKYEIICLLSDEALARGIAKKQFGKSDIDLNAIKEKILHTGVIPYQDKYIAAAVRAKKLLSGNYKLPGKCGEVKWEEADMAAIMKLLNSPEGGALRDRVEEYAIKYAQYGTIKEQQKMLIDITKALANRDKQTRGRFRRKFSQDIKALSAQIAEAGLEADAFTLLAMAIFAHRLKEKGTTSKLPLDEQIIIIKQSGGGDAEMPLETSKSEMTVNIVDSKSLEEIKQFIEQHYEMVIEILRHVNIYPDEFNNLLLMPSTFAEPYVVYGALLEIIGGADGDYYKIYHDFYNNWVRPVSMKEVIGRVKTLNRDNMIGWLNEHRDITGPLLDILDIEVGPEELDDSQLKIVYGLVDAASMSYSKYVPFETARQKIEEVVQEISPSKAKKEQSTRDVLGDAIDKMQVVSADELKQYMAAHYDMVMEVLHDKDVHIDVNEFNNLLALAPNLFAELYLIYGTVIAAREGAGRHYSRIYHQLHDKWVRPARVDEIVNQLENVNRSEMVQWLRERKALVDPIIDMLEIITSVDRLDDNTLKLVYGLARLVQKGGNEHILFSEARKALMEAIQERFSETFGEDYHDKLGRILI